VRIYYHLKDSQESIPDNNGVEVSNLQEAHTQAYRVIEELRQENSRFWSGWVLIAADEAGNALFSIELDRTT
jgi:hypothetical protein